MIKVLFAFLLCIFSLNANEDILQNQTNEIYFLPNESSEVVDKISESILNAKSDILIAMYNFSYKKFAKDLVEASKNGVEITVLLDEEKLDKDDEIYKYLTKNKIKIILPKDKTHLKIAIIDNEFAILGSANWTKESFIDNHELIIFTTDKKLIEKSVESILDIK